MATHPMSAADAAWFHNDGPANEAIMSGVLLTKKPLDFATVCAVFEERLQVFPRFRQRVVESGLAFSTPHWVDVPQFDIRQHLHHIALSAPHDEEALRTLVSDITSAPMDHAQPLWQAHVVDNVMGGSALVIRCHHCMADGTGMMAVANRLLDAEPGPWKPATTSPMPVATNGSGFMAVADAVVHAAAHPKEALGQAAAILGGAGMLVGELLKKDDPPSPLKGTFALGKQVAWSLPVAIADVKEIGTQHGAKVNDVLVAAMTGALRHYLADHGIDVNHTSVRAMVPVDLRPPQDAERLGNAFGLVLLDLAVSQGRAEHRLQLTKERMDALKHSPEPMATRALLEILGRVPKALEDFSNNLFGKKASLVMTNVVGPRQTLHLAGVPIERMLAWAPHPGKQLGMAISILSYNGMANLTVISDAHLLPDPQRIAFYFNAEFQYLLGHQPAVAPLGASKQGSAKRPAAKNAAAKKAAVRTRKRA